MVRARMTTEPPWFRTPTGTLLAPHIVDRIAAVDLDDLADAAMTDTERTTITCTDRRITSITVGTQTRDEIEVDWATTGLPTRSGRTIHLSGLPDVAIVAADEDAAEELLRELSARHHVAVGGLP